MKKYQEENPNNCRVSIDFNNPKNPVKFEYVGDKTPHQICRSFFVGTAVRFFLLPTCVISGMLVGLSIAASNNELRYYYTFMAIVVLVFMIYGMPFLLGLLFSRTKLIKLMPYMWSFAKVRYYAYFTSDDVVDNRIEIPLYDNVFLGYVLEGDFENKIDRIEVIEHPFLIKIRGNKKNRFRRNDYLWRATFYFKEKPAYGELRVKFT